MREFQDDRGATWVAAVQERPGDDYKGRFSLVLFPGEGSASEAIPLGDVRWNSAASADRTLRTMSVVELRRRLRSAAGRAALEV